MLEVHAGQRSKSVKTSQTRMAEVVIITPLEKLAIDEPRARVRRTIVTDGHREGRAALLVSGACSLHFRNLEHCNLQRCNLTAL